MSKTAWTSQPCIFFLVATFWLTLGSIGVPGAELVIPPAPPGEPAFEDCAVQVDGNPVPVYQAKVNRSAPGHGLVPETVGFATFDFVGKVEVKVVFKGKLNHVNVSPRSYGISPTVRNGTVTFLLSRPGQLCLEWNRSDRRPLFLFANPLEFYPGGIPRPGQEKVRYFGPGVHRAGLIRLHSGETVYLAGGAIVYGKIVAEGVKGARILGRGILDGSQFKQWETNLLTVNHSSDVVISGIILRDSPCWTVVPSRCDKVRISGVKILNYRKNSDGINAVNSRHVLVEDCFVRNYDDSIVVKATQPDARNVEDITIRNCVVWCDWGFSLGMTYEARVAQIRGLVFRNCDVLHGMACRGVLGVKNGDRAEVVDVLFDDIRIEDARVQLLELVIDKDMWSKDDRRGQIRNVTFLNVFLTGGSFVPSNLTGFDAEHFIEGVTFENLRIHGKLITNATEGKIAINRHVRNVRFVSPRGTVPGTSDRKTSNP